MIPSRNRERKSALYERLIRSVEEVTRRLARSRLLRPKEGNDELMARLCRFAPPECIRMYVCDREGSQTSSNWVRSGTGGWQADPTYRGANWSWRPYFIPAVALMSSKRQGFLSPRYKDLETKNVVQTFACPAGGSRFVFFDVTAEESQNEA